MYPCVSSIKALSLSFNRIFLYFTKQIQMEEKTTDPDLTYIRKECLGKWGESVGRIG